MGEFWISNDEMRKSHGVLVLQHNHKRSVFVGNLSFGELLCSFLASTCDEGERHVLNVMRYMCLQR